MVDRVVQNKASATRAWFASAPASSENWSPSDDDGSSMSKLFNKTDDHAALRQMIRSFTEREVISFLFYQPLSALSYREVFGLLIIN